MRNTDTEKRRGPDRIPDHCSTETKLRVRFSETDGMGIVSHARFFDYFEVAREEYMRRRGVLVDRVFASGYNLPLSQMHVRFDRPARYGDVLTVEIRLAYLSRAQLRFDYRVLAAGESLAFGWTEHVFTTQDLKLRHIPREFMQQLLSAGQPDGP